MIVCNSESILSATYVAPNRYSLNYIDKTLVLEQWASHWLAYTQHTCNVTKGSHSRLYLLCCWRTSWQNYLMLKTSAVRLTVDHWSVIASLYGRVYADYAERAVLYVKCSNVMACYLIRRLGIPEHRAQIE